MIPDAPAVVARAGPDISKSIAIAVDPELRARVERLWQTYNEKSTIAATKSAIYREVMAQGVRSMELTLGITT